MQPPGLQYPAFPLYYDSFLEKARFRRNARRSPSWGIPVRTGDPFTAYPFGEISDRMLYLTCSSKLAALRRILVSSFPESLKVCGAVHHVIHHDNPFKLQVLVDQWPEFTSVICRPPLEEMTDPLDIYTNTYFLFSKDPQSLHQMLQNPQAVNWKQELQIHDEWQFTPLLTHEAHLVHGQAVARNYKLTINYIERCIKNFPSICVRKKGLDQPIAWSVTEQSAEIRMGYIEPAYRNMGIARIVLLKFAAVNHTRGAPIYVSVAPDNEIGQAALNKSGFRLSGRCLQWRFQHQVLNAK